MAKGMAIPVRVNRRGGAATIEGTPYVEQTISVGLTPNLSRNPFQAGGGVELGISERFVFANDTPGTRAGARLQIVRAFARWRAEEIAKLAPGNEGLSFEDGNDGELVANVRYVDLEADAEGEVRTNLKDALRSGPSVNYSGR